MPPDRPSEREKDLFLDAADLDPAARDEFLSDACADEPSVLERVRKLLAAHDRASAALAAAAGGSSEHFDDELVPGASIGDYTLVRELAEGGFGTVWLAEQREPVRREVALKVLKPGIGSREVVARFEAERQALAVMDHPHIARVFDGGSTERGRPFFVMEFVDGEPITRFCASRGLDIDARLRLFSAVCDAVQHAHQKGVIHRDIKPNNVLVTTVDGRPFAKVIDFGIAKATDARLTEKTLHTHGRVVGTPAYMSPEQADGDADIDTRTDVYSLGVLLYELISGTTPFDARQLAEAGLSETIRTIREVDPPLPSIRLLRGDGSSTITPRRVRGDLDWITMRCLEKDRQRRYSSVAVLSNEIVRHLRGDPVLAGPPSVRYRVGKFARKHRAGLATTAVLLITLVAATVVSWTQATRATAAAALAGAEARRAREQTERAQVELERFRAIASFTEHLFASIEPAVARGRDTSMLRDLLDLADRRIDQLMSGRPTVEAALRRLFGHAYRSIGALDRAEENLRRAYEIRATELPSDHPERLESAHDLGLILMQSRRIADAMPLLEQAAEGRRRVLGPDHTDTMSSLGQLAVALRMDGDPARSVEILEDVTRVMEAQLGPTHTSTLTEKNNLAAAYEDAGRLDDAARLFEEVLRRQVAKRGSRNEYALATYSNLAGVYRQQGNLEAASKMLEEALEIKRQILPPGHPSLLIGMNNLAGIWRATGKHDEARDLFEEALALAREHHGESSQFTLTLRVALAQHVAQSGDRATAAELVDGVRGRIEEQLGRSDPLIPLVATIEVDLLLDRGSFAAAEAAAVAALGRHADLAGPARAPLAVLTIQRGLALAGLGRDADALRTLEAERTFEVRAGDEWRRRADAAIARLSAGASGR